MGIKVEKPDYIPELVYENIHLEELKIIQTRPTVNPPMPKYQLWITYRLYAVEEDSDVRHYSPKPRIVHMEDYMEKALFDMQRGDPRLIQALGAIEQALAKILDQDGTHGTATVE